MKRHPFTLIELLMVISIIAILSSMLIPSLSNGREKTRQISCMNQVKQFLTATVSYSTDNLDYVPMVDESLDSCNSLWDLSPTVTDVLLYDEGIDKWKRYFCPNNEFAYSEDTWNHPSGTRRLTGYFWLYQRTEGDALGTLDPTDTLNGVDWVTKTTTGLNETSTDRIILMADATNYSIPAASFNIPVGVTNHTSAVNPKGSNVGFLDGHVVWKYYPEMLSRYSVDPAGTWEQWF